MTAMYRGQVAEVSNRENLELFFQLIDEDTGEAIDLTTSDLVCRVTDQSGCERISASLEDGKITLVEDTTLRIFIPRSDMTNLCIGTYPFGLTVENDEITKSLIAGTIAVIDGVVGT